MKTVGQGDLVVLTESGLYCPPGDFYIDAWAPVKRCIITHAHSDHARVGSEAYLCAASGAGVLRARLGEHATIETVQYNEPITLADVRVSLHPAGHVLGSAQIRIEHKGEVWVLSGDYKLAKDPTCDPFDPVTCDTFISEATFGLPIYRWRDTNEVLDQINTWWQTNNQSGKCSILFGYALGKAQRILAGLNGSIGAIYTHGAVEKLTEQYRQAGIALPQTTYVAALPRGAKYGGSLILAPPSAQNSPWMRQFGLASTAFASGWMRIRGTRRRKSVDKGFVFSDHADWDALNQAIRATEAERVILTHGYAPEMARWLNECGLQAGTMATHFEGELGEMQPAAQVDNEVLEPEFTNEIHNVNSAEEELANSMQSMQESQE